MYALSKIEACKEQRFYMEALLKNYHLNLDLIKFMLSSSVPKYSAKDKKAKVILREFTQEIESNVKLKAILNKRNLKAVKPWLNKMDCFFKTVKLHYPDNVRALQADAEKVFVLLNISANKLFVQDRM